MHYLDASLPSEVRADLLLKEMTLAEKCHQLTSVMPWRCGPARRLGRGLSRGVAPESAGSRRPTDVDDPARLADLVGAIQLRFVTRTRLGIPAVLHAEALSGFLAGGYTSFPTGTGLAATWSPELVEEMADLIRRQMPRVGMPHALSPVMDIALDPRWGRVHETYGEDPYLCAAFSVAYTRGLQGNDLLERIAGGTDAGVEMLIPRLEASES